MSDNDAYTILATEPCRFGVVVTHGPELRDIVEKPDFILCSDGKWRLRDKEGRIYEQDAR